MDKSSTPPPRRARAGRPAPGPAPAAEPTILNFIQEVLKEDLSPAQGVLLKSIYGLPLTEGEKVLFHAYTGREGPPGVRQHEVTCICGRRSGKTGRIGVNIALYEALMGGHEACLGHGERGHVVLIAQTVKAVHETMALARSKVNGSAILAAELVRERADELWFRNGMCVSIWPCTVKSVRGLHVPVSVLDEIGFWESEGANPDIEVVRAVAPAGATFPGRMMVKLSTPWAKAGVLWDDYTAWWAKDGGPLVWLAPTKDMNPTVPLDFLVREYTRDPDAARREYDAEFADPAEAFIPGASVEAAIAGGIHERAYERGRHYMAAIDVAFKNDATVLTIVHREGERVVQDVCRAWKPSPGAPLKLSELARQVAILARLYGVRTVYGDQYAAEPVREALRHPRTEDGRLLTGVGFVEVAYTATRKKRDLPEDPSRREVGASKMDLFGTMKTLVVQGRLSLLDVPETAKQLKALMVKRTFSGYETVGAPEGAHDDYAAALALACWQAWQATERREATSRVIMPLRGGTLLDAQLVEGDDWDALLPHELREAPEREPRGPHGLVRRGLR